MHLASKDFALLDEVSEGLFCDDTLLFAIKLILILFSFVESYCCSEG